LGAIVGCCPIHHSRMLSVEKHRAMSVFLRSLTASSASGLRMAFLLHEA
jgi:hypothetical protein